MQKAGGRRGEASTERHVLVRLGGRRNPNSYGSWIDGEARSLGLDVMRGAVMVGLAVLVFTPWTGWRGHAAWWGWRPSDAFFPLFLTVAGAGLALQTKRGVPWTRVIRRFVSLIVLGLLVNALLGAGLDLTKLRFTGVLQRIALAGLVGAAILAVARRRWVWVTGAAVALCVAWGAVILIAASSCPGGEPAMSGCGTLHGVDRAIFGRAHVYGAGAAGHDPEGLVSTLGATASFLAGSGAVILMTDRRFGSAARRALALTGVAAGWLALSLPLLIFAPFGKRMWTPVFVSMNAAGALALLAVLTVVFDWPLAGTASRLRGALAWPFVAVGRNALLSWTSLFIVDHALDVSRSGGGSLEESLLGSFGSYGYTVVMLGAWITVWCVMHAARWYVRL
ncbi:MAG TPA: heparan-alpha-glucosaminide N-acetyltransferase domain-containing protein [Acidimicrobiales bacterium]|nr:heparan-alpha-glucosaminide N-acetyltransferase domain-containing protein [Acidimicrobiales bacterium]